MKVYCYSKCSTCRKALQWLEEHGIAYELLDIKTEHPDEDELRRYYAMSELPLKRFFNTSGIQYREQELTKKLPTMPEDEQLRLLASDGMLVKRPLVVGEDFVLTGFREEEWTEKLLTSEICLHMTENNGMPSVCLKPMTDRMYHAYYKEYQNDPDLYLDKRQCTPFVYSAEWVDNYIRRQVSRNRICLAIMLGDEMAGEVIIKNIEPGKCATLGICMKNDACKNRGIGTRAERLVIDYVFHELDIPVLYADTFLTNERSRHVLGKVGFRCLRTEGDFKDYCISRHNASKSSENDGI